MKKEYEFVAVGMKYRSNHVFSQNDVGSLSFQPEEDNPYDPNAVQILLNDAHVAYVSKEHNKRIRRILRKYGCTGIQFVESFAASARLRAQYEKNS